MFLNNLKESLFINAKQLVGWRTDRKIVVFSVDDYGNVRLDSPQAKERMDQNGLEFKSRFDALDTLETRKDLEMLFETLETVEDKNGQHAVFTPFALACNINFEKLAQNGYRQYEYETLPQTFKKLKKRHASVYEDAWELWKEGIESGIMVPQFHGREHFNLKIFNEKLKNRDRDLMNVLNNRSYIGISSNEYDTISPMAAFDFDKFEESNSFDKIIMEGLNAFEEVFGYRAENFIAPGGSEHHSIHKTLFENGIRYLDAPLFKSEHQGSGKYKTVFNYTGKKNKFGQTFLVRNVVFEPTEKRDVNWVSFALKQIDAAFRWNRPAIISSHRVNFCGFADPSNRDKGIQALQQLLDTIVKRWPDVEFMSANKLGRLIENNK